MKAFILTINGKTSTIENMMEGMNIVDNIETPSIGLLEIKTVYQGDAKIDIYENDELVDTYVWIPSTQTFGYWRG
jgi:hypothetical protein